MIEGNRGLFDGLDAAGTHSTATLARLVRAAERLGDDARPLLDAYLDDYPSGALVLVRRMVNKLSTEALREIVADVCGCSHCGTFGHEVPECPESEWEWDALQKEWRQV